MNKFNALIKNLLTLSSLAETLIFALWPFLMIALVMTGFVYMEAHWHSPHGKNIGGAILIAVAVAGLLKNRRRESTQDSTNPKN